MPASHTLDLLLPPGARPDKQLLKRLKSQRARTALSGRPAIAQPAKPQPAKRLARASQPAKPAEPAEPAAEVPDRWAAPNPWRRVRTLPCTPLAKAKRQPATMTQQALVNRQALVTHEFSKIEQEFFETGDGLAAVEEPAPAEPRIRWWQRLMLTR